MKIGKLIFAGCLLAALLSSATFEKFGIASADRQSSFSTDGGPESNQTQPLPGPTSLQGAASGKTVTLNWQKPTEITVPKALVRPIGMKTDGKFSDIFFPDGNFQGFFSNATNSDLQFCEGEQFVPASYPATLKNVLFLSASRLFKGTPSPVGAKFKLFVFSSPTALPTSQSRLLLVNDLKTYEVEIQRDIASTVNIKDPTETDSGDFNEFSVPDYTITGGSFFVLIQYSSPGTSEITTGRESYSFRYANSTVSGSVFSEDNAKTFKSPDVFTLPNPNRTVIANYPFLVRVAQGSSQTPPKVTGINLYRSTVSPAFAPGNRVATIAASGDPTFTDSPPTADGRTRYFYAVTAAYDSGAESAPSNEIEVVPGTLDTTPPTVKLVAPNGGETFAGGFTLNIFWESTDNVALAGHSVDLSTDGGNTFGTSIAVGLGAEVKSFAYSIPTNLATTTARVRVTARDTSGNTATAVSAGNFTIQPVDRTPPTVTVVSPNGGEKATSGTNLPILWRSSDNVRVASHVVFLSLDGGATYPIQVAAGLDGAAQSFVYAIPASTKSKTARIRVTARDADGNEGKGESAANFSIKKAKQ